MYHFYILLGSSQYSDVGQKPVVRWVPADFVSVLFHIMFFLHYQLRQPPEIHPFIMCS